MNNNMPVPTNLTTAFYAQAVISFALSLTAITAGIVYLPVNAWIRAFLFVGVLYTVTSTFTLAKCVRDSHEAQRVVQRVDEARLERLFTEHNPYNPAL